MTNRLTKSSILACVLTISIHTVFPLKESGRMSCCETRYIQDATVPEREPIHDNVIIYRNKNATVHNNETRYIQNATVFNENTTVQNSETIYNENPIVGNNETAYDQNSTARDNEMKRNESTTVDVVFDRTRNATSSSNSYYKNEPQIHPTNSALCTVKETNQFWECGYRICLEPHEYVMKNEIAFVEGFRVTLNCSSYKTIRGGCLMICPPPSKEGKTRPNEKKYSSVLAYITLIGLWISILCLALHLTAFAMVPEVRNVPGCCIACLCSSLLFGYLSFLVGFDPNIISSKSACAATCASTHFFMLSSVLWMNAMAFDVFKSVLHASGKLKLKCPRFVGVKKFYMCCLYAWGVSLIFTVAAIISSNGERVPEDHKSNDGRRMCWFSQSKTPLAFLIVPVFTVTCTNTLFFGWCVYVMASNKIKVSVPHESALKENVVMYGRLGVVMGLSWMAWLLASLTDVLFMWYTFVVLNTVQGLFIFRTFTWTPKVKKLFLQRLGYQNVKDNTQSEMSVQNSTLQRII